MINGHSSTVSYFINTTQVDPTLYAKVYNTSDVDHCHSNYVAINAYNCASISGIDRLSVILGHNNPMHSYILDLPNAVLCTV